MQAEIDVINASWNVGATSNGLADSVGLMVYEGTQVLVIFLGHPGVGKISLRGHPGIDRIGPYRNTSIDRIVRKKVVSWIFNFSKALQYVKNYAEGSSQWEGFPIKVP